MSGDVIKSFMVGLGFGVDESSLSKFNKALTSATVKVTALYVATAAMAAGIVKSLSNISGEFEQMGYEYHLIAPAINKALLLRQELLKAYSAAGVNIYKTIQASIKLNFSLAKTGFALKALYSGVASKFFPLLQKQSDTFRKSLYANMPKIQNALESFIRFIFKSIQVMTTLGQRLWSILTSVYDFFVKLDKATDGWSTIILGAVAAWKLLNLSFLATPLGMLLTGLVALLALWDDFKTFKEGGQALINWGSEFTKTLVGLAAAIAAVAVAFVAWQVISGIISGIRAAIVAFNGVLTIMDALLVIAAAPFWAIAAAIGAIIAALTLADAKWNIFGGHLSGFFSGIGGKIMDFAGGSGPSVPPVGQGVQNSQTNQNVNQQTQININGASDAHATGAAVAGQQTRVNRDSIDYLKGATK